MHTSECTAKFDLPDEASSIAFGALLAPCLQPGMVVYLEGNLGAGKTTMVRALLRAKGHEGPVKSPTYALVEDYVFSSLYLYHFDFYRFESPEEFLDAGFSEYFHENSICLVEWPDRAAGCMPTADLRLCLQHQGDGRSLDVVALSPMGVACLTSLKSTLSGGAACGISVPQP